MFFVLFFHFQVIELLPKEELENSLQEIVPGLLKVCIFKKKIFFEGGGGGH